MGQMWRTLCVCFGILHLQVSDEVHCEPNQSIRQFTLPMCKFESDGQGSWNADGCTLINFDNSTGVVECHCTHLASFACLVVSDSLTTYIFTLTHQLPCTFIHKCTLKISVSQDVLAHQVDQTDPPVSSTVEEDIRYMLIAVDTCVFLSLVGLFLTVLTFLIFK